MLLLFNTKYRTHSVSEFYFLHTYNFKVFIEIISDGLIKLLPFRCLHCSSTLYCNESCCSKSWDETHQWECTGFTVNLWGTIGLAFPAYRLCLKNILNCYRLEAENYNLAQKLLTNIAKNENVLEFLVVSCLLLYWVALLSIIIFKVVGI